MQIFTDDVDYRRFVYVLTDVIEGFGLECWNYCLMPNHYHLTLVPRCANLSESVRRLNSVYAQWWNHRHGRVGHVFQGRFKDQIVEREGYLLALSRYVVMNPVRARLVERPDDWLWSSYRATAGLIPCPAFLDVKPTLALFSDRAAEQQARFRALITGEIGDESLADQIRSNERVLGTRAFKLSVRSPDTPPLSDNCCPVSQPNALLQLNVSDPGVSPELVQAGQSRSLQAPDKVRVDVT